MLSDDGVLLEDTKGESEGSCDESEDDTNRKSGWKERSDWGQGKYLGIEDNTMSYLIATIYFADSRKDEKKISG